MGVVDSNTAFKLRSAGINLCHSRFSAAPEIAACDSVLNLTRAAVYWFSANCGTKHRHSRWFALYPLQISRLCQRFGAGNSAHTLGVGLTAQRKGRGDARLGFQELQNSPQCSRWAGET